MFGWISNFIEQIATSVFWREICSYEPECECPCDPIPLHPEIRVQLDEGAWLPVRFHDTDAGADLRCREAFTVPAGDSCVIDTGVHVQLPPNTVGMIKSKSGLNVRSCLATEGVVDQGYKGSILVRLYNFGQYDYRFEAGDKVTQLVILPVLFPSYAQVDEIEGGARGDAGFGSSGR